MLKTHPFAAPDSALKGVILEGDLQSKHGHLGKNDQIDQGQGKQKIELPGPYHPSGQTCGPPAPGLSYRRACLLVSVLSLHQKSPHFILLRSPEKLWEQYAGLPQARCSQTGVT